MFKFGRIPFLLTFQCEVAEVITALVIASLLTSGTKRIVMCSVYFGPTNLGQQMTRVF